MFVVNNKCWPVTHFRIVCSNCVRNFIEIDQFITPKKLREKLLKMYVQIQDGCHVGGGVKLPLKNSKKIFTMLI